MKVRGELARRQMTFHGTLANAPLVQRRSPLFGRAIWSAVVAVVSVLALAACSSGAPPVLSPADAKSSFSTDAYRLGPDDIIQVDVWGNPGLSVEVPVRPDGMISMPLLGDVRAGGLTAEEVSKSISERLSRDIRNPIVVVIVQELRSHEFVSRVRVTGAVVESISIPHRPGMTVLDAVLEAGGPSEFASPDKAVLFRKAGTSSARMPVRLNRIMKKGDLSTNYEMQPGDIVSIPERVF